MKAIAQYFHVHYTVTQGFQDFSRTLNNFIWNNFANIIRDFVQSTYEQEMEEILVVKSVNPYKKTLLMPSCFKKNIISFKFNRFPELCSTIYHFPELSSPGKFHGKIPGLSWIFRTRKNLECCSNVFSVDETPKCEAVKFPLVLFV